MVPVDLLVVNDINALNPVYNKWYMDDGGIVGDVETDQSVGAHQATRPRSRLASEPCKVRVELARLELRTPLPIRLDGVKEEDQVKLIPTSEIHMLGVPLGNDGFTAEFVEKKLFSRLNHTIGQLIEFEDSQAALYLLRVSYSIVRAVHFMRSTPLRERDKFDALIRNAAEQILVSYDRRDVRSSEPHSHTGLV